MTEAVTKFQWSQTGMTPPTFFREMLSLLGTAAGGGPGECIHQVRRENFSR